MTIALPIILLNILCCLEMTAQMRNRSFTFHANDKILHGYATHEWSFKNKTGQRIVRINRTLI